MMWKIAIASMLLATTAFGAISLGPSASSVTVVNGTADVTLVMTGAGEAVGNFSVYPVADKPDFVKISNRVLSAGNLLTETGTDLATVQAARLDADNTIDLGLIHPTKNATMTVNGSQNLMVLTFAVSDTKQLPITISFLGGAWAGSGGQGGDSIADCSVTLVPEPASMLLVAVGAAFFARRRRA